MKVKEIKLLVQRVGDNDSLNMLTTKLYPPFNCLWIFEHERTIYTFMDKKMFAEDAKKLIATFRSLEFWIRVSGEIVIRSNFDVPAPHLSENQRNGPNEIIFELEARKLEFLPL